MSKKSSLIRAGAVLTVALSAGHFVQTVNDKTRAEGQTQVASGPDSNVTEVSAVVSTAATAAVTVPTKLQQVSAGPSYGANANAIASVSSQARFAPDVSVAPSALTRAGEAPEAEASVQLASLGDELPSLAARTPPSLNQPSLDQPTFNQAAANRAAAADNAAPAAAAEPAAQDCAPTLQLSAKPGHLLEVTLSAPCAAQTRVVLRHAGLVIAERLDASGALRLELPALEASGQVAVLFDDASSLQAAQPIAGLERGKRFGVQWLADDNFQLHVMENGADYGMPGHLSAEDPAAVGQGRFMVLGDPSLELPMLAQIYSWPESGSTRAAPVVEAEVTELTCDRDLLGETLLLLNGVLTTRELVLSMPDCDASGDILVLNNLLADVTLATAN